MSSYFPESDEQVAVLREFNRFYTARFGLLCKQYLDSEFSLTEARLLYEIGISRKLTASALCKTLGLDAGYISRVLGALTRREFVSQTTSESDGREKLLTLSPSGEEKVAEINRQSRLQIKVLLDPLSIDERDELTQLLSKVHSILNKEKKAGVQIVRLSEMNDDARRLLWEYYEAIQVVQRDTSEEIKSFVADYSSGIWLAYLRDEAVGCVVLRPLVSTPFAGECKRLYVRPDARGLRIADALLEAQETFARDRGLQWIYLDSRDDLESAIALYQKRGYLPCGRYNDNPEATIFLRKQIGKSEQPGTSGQHLRNKDAFFI